MKILYFMHNEWNWIKQRPHYIAEELSQKNHVYVWYDKSYKKTNVTHNSTNILLGSKPREFFRLPKDYAYRIIFSVNSLMRRWVILFERLIHKVDTIYITYPTMIAAIPRNYSGRIIYDCMDDHIALASSQAKSYVAKWEKIALERADLVVFTSLFLSEIVKQRNSGIAINDILVRNGYTNKETTVAGYEEYGDRNDNTYKLCYFGTVGSWFDWDAIKCALDKNETLQMHIIGPVNDPTAQINHSRVIYYGAVKHEELAQLTRNMDAFIMPFVLNDIVLSVDPVKLYEYIALGKDIIVPYYKEIERFSDFVYFYSNKNDFSDVIRRVMENGHRKYTSDQQTAFLKESTWKVRAHLIEEAMK